MQYSLDKVRVAGIAPVWAVERFFKRFETDLNLRFWIGTKISDYGYNFSFMHDESVIYFGCCHNSEKRGEKTRFVIEYNPNKMNSVSEWILWEMRDYFRPKELILVHFAIDVFEYPMSSFLVDRGKKQIYKVFDTPAGKTIYVGQSGNTGYLKVYDKAKEQKVDGDWVRIEYVVRIDEFFSRVSCKNFDFSSFPVVYIIRGSPVSAEEKALIFALQSDVISLHDISRYKKKKLAERIFQQVSIDEGVLKGLLNNLSSFWSK